MTLVLSMNPFCDHTAASEGEAMVPQYQPIWESERCSKSCVSSPSPIECTVEQLAEEPHCRRPPDHAATSRIAYIKRKYVEDEEPNFSFRSYCQTVAPVLEERAHVLRLSLEKMRFIDDPEVFLRRSVLINNLLRRLRAEILLQSEWCFPPGPTPMSTPCSGPAPLCPWEAQQIGRPCFSPQGPYRKRFRLIRGESPECLQTCCCFYGSRYMRLPFSVYDDGASSLPSTSSSSSLSFPQLLPSECREARLDSLYPALDPTEAGRPSGVIEAKERGRLRERVFNSDGERVSARMTNRSRDKAEVAGHSKWVVPQDDLKSDHTKKKQ